MFGDYLILGIGALTVLLVVLAAIRPRLKKYKLISPLKKVEPRKHRTKHSHKKPREIVIRLGGRK